MSLKTPHERRQTREITLSDRERHYLGLVARGKHPSHIALVTGAKEAEVKDVLEAVRTRLGAANLPNAVSISLLRGLIEQDI